MLEEIFSYIVLEIEINIMLNYNLLLQLMCFTRIERNLNKLNIFFRNIILTNRNHYRFMIVRCINISK